MTRKVTLGASILAIMTAVAMLLTTSPTAAAKGGGHMYTLIHTNNTLLQTYAVETENTNGVVGRVIMTSPPASSGEPTSAHVIGLNGIVQGNYPVWFVQSGKTPVYAGVLPYIPGVETEAMSPIPAGFTTGVQLYIEGFRDATGSFNMSNMILNTDPMKLIGAGSGSGGGSGGHGGGSGGGGSHGGR